MNNQHPRNFGTALLAMAALGLAACADSPTSNDVGQPVANPAALIGPTAQGELYACKFSVDPVTLLPNGDATSGRITATLVSGDGTIDPGVTGGNSALISYNIPNAPQCVKVWSGGTSATVAVTEDPEPGSALLFYRLAKRTPGEINDEVYFMSSLFNPVVEGPTTVNVAVDNSAAYEIWFKNVTVETPPPPGGCTYTQGYWKTHSDRGPAGPYDDGWKNVGALEEDTPFFNSGTTWYQVWQTAPKGNAFYILAHQYMAAKLNVLNGASSTADVDAAIAGAEALFGSLAAGSVTLTPAQTTQAKAWATTLDNYNKGLIGPGHCTDEVI